jgi:hypothetical protein
MGERDSIRLMELEKLAADAARTEREITPRRDPEPAGRQRRPDASEVAVPRSGSGGRPIPTDLRSHFEGSLGRDLGGVRVHTDGAANEAADELDSRAFATGNDIYFAAGEYDPSSREGKTLLGHEVAHTVQNNGAGAGIQAKSRVSEPGDASEIEADRAAEAMVIGAPASIEARPSAGIQRKPKAKSESKDKGSGLDPKKPPKWTGNSVSFKAFGKDTKIELDRGVTVGVDLGGAKIPMMKPIEHAIHVPWGPGGIKLTAKASAEAEATAGGKFSVKEFDWPGPWAEDVEPTGLTIFAEGKAGVSFTVKGSIGFGGYVGVPYMNLSAEGELTLTATAGMDLILSGGGTVNPMGDVMGFAAMIVNSEAKVTGSGALNLNYAALIDSGTLFTHSLFNTDIATAFIKVVAGQDLSSGAPVEAVSYDAKWAEWPASEPPEARPLRPLTEEEKARLERERDGASGSGPVGPDDMVEIDCDDPRNDGAGGAAADCRPDPSPEQEAAQESAKKHAPAADDGGGAAGGAGGHDHGGDGAGGHHGGGPGGDGGGGHGGMGPA